MTRTDDESASVSRLRERLCVPTAPRVVILGDSGASGLGVHGRSFGIEAAELLEASDRLRLARSRMLVDDTVKLLPRIFEFQPDLVLFGTGMAEGLVHPGVWFEEFVTRHGPGSRASSAGLEPRMLFSGNRYKRYRQRAGSMANVIVKQIGIGLTGGASRMPLEEYETHLDELVRTLTERKVPVILIGIAHASRWLFPRSNKNVQAYDLVQRRIVDRYPLARLLRVKDVLDGRSDVQIDRLHPNELGHRKLAEAIVGCIRTEDRPSGLLSPDSHQPGSP